MTMELPYDIEYYALNPEKVGGVDYFARYLLGEGRKSLAEGNAQAFQNQIGRVYRFQQAVNERARIDGTTPQVQLNYLTPAVVELLKYIEQYRLGYTLVDLRNHLRKIALNEAVGSLHFDADQNPYDYFEDLHTRKIHPLDDVLSSVASHGILKPLDRSNLTLVVPILWSIRNELSVLKGEMKPRQYAALNKILKEKTKQQINEYYYDTDPYGWILWTFLLTLDVLPVQQWIQQGGTIEPAVVQSNPFRPGMFSRN